MKLGITGSRSTRDFDFTFLFKRQNREFNIFLGRRRITGIITGGAHGIDRQAEKCAGKLNIPCLVIRPDYPRYHRGAPLKRNLQIIERADAVLAVWNGDPRSRGTVYTAVHALRSGKPVFVIISGTENVIQYAGEINDPDFFTSAAINQEIP